MFARDYNDRGDEKQHREKHNAEFGCAVHVTKVDFSSSPRNCVHASQLIYFAMYHSSDLTNFYAKCCELLGENGLYAVGEGFLRLVMNFDEQPIRSDSHRRPREWQHLVPFACAMTGVHEYRKVAAFFHPGNDRKVQRVPGKIGERAYAALAEHHVVISFRQNIFGSHQEFIERGGHPPLKQNWPLGTSRALKKRKILHIARTDLDYVGIFLNQIKRFVVDGFGDDPKAKLVANFGQNFQAGLS